MCECEYKWACARLCVCAHVCLRVCAHVCVCVCVCVWVHVCVYMYVSYTWPWAREAFLGAVEWWPYKKQVDGLRCILSLGSPSQHRPPANSLLLGLSTSIALQSVLHIFQRACNQRHGYSGRKQLSAPLKQTTLIICVDDFWQILFYDTLLTLNGRAHKDKTQKHFPSSGNTLTSC
jgi:hypothetical protein